MEMGFIRSVLGLSNSNDLRRYRFHFSTMRFISPNSFAALLSDMSK
jgi:hypothetical protein